MKMRLFALALAVTVTAFAQVRPEQFPGQSEHREPPKDWMCSNLPNAPKDHKCDCKRSCAKPIDPESGEEMAGPMTVQEDRACAVWCWPDHCTCPVKCGDTH